MTKVKVSDLLIFVLSAELAGALSAAAASAMAGEGFSAYYNTLVKPPLAPPGWLFPVVWGIMYALMGFAAYLVNESVSAVKKQALDLYWLQLFANVLWAPAFFGLRSNSVAVAVVIMMTVLISLAAWAFFRVRKSAGYLMLPYLAWTLFAAYLSIGFYLLNP